jgi:Zn-dependent protease with chaperone function
VRGFLLYSVTLIIELVSVGVRFILLSAFLMLFLDQNWALALGAIAGLAPPARSLLVLAGVPSGHRAVRRSLRARPLNAAEQARFDQAVQPIRDQGVVLPQTIFTVPAQGLNAAVSGRTLYIFQDLYTSRYLPGIIAHELGHYHSLDGRMLLALRSLTVPGGFMFVYVMLQLLQWIAYALSLALSGLLILVFMLFRLRLAAAVGAIFDIVMTLLRMLIIFAVGGVGPAMLGSFWRNHFIEREYAADAYAARLGYAGDLIAFFQHHVLTDVSIPWYEQPTHPPSSRRIANLRNVAATAPHPSAARSTAASPTAEPAFDAMHAAPAAAFLARSPLPAYIPALLAGVITLLLVGAVLLINGQTGAPPGLPIPTPGPTPTLGVPGV